MKKDIQNNISRRDFLKMAGIGTAAFATSAVTGCASDNNDANSANPALGEIPTDKMTFRTNPNSNDTVSVLGYGCMRWPTLPDVEKGQNVIDQETVNRLVDFALEHGINYFDTAPVYIQGWSETSTGIALKRHPRSSYFIATKMSNFADFSREGSIAMYRESMKRLQTDYFDYYLLHNLGRSMENFSQRFIDNGVLDFLLKERKAGRIRNLGWSFHGDKAVFDQILAMHEEVHWDFVQIQMNYQDWRHAGNGNVNAEYLYGELTKRGIPVVVMEPLLGGRLAKVPDHVASRLKQRDSMRSIASWAFRFVGSHPDILTVLSGMTYMEHLQDNLRSFCPFVPLSEADNEFLFETATLLAAYPTIPCTDCKYCMPCPYGLDIPAIFAHYNKCVNEGNVVSSTGNDNYRKARKAFLIGYDRSVPKLRQASHCIKCGACVSHCPQKIRIPRELERIDKYVEDLKQGKEF